MPTTEAPAPILAAPRDTRVRSRRPETAPVRWWALPVLLVAVFMTTLDFFVVNAVAPATRSDLGAGHATLQAVVIGYGLAYAAGLITAGRLGDLYGHRRVFAAGLALFTAASALCGLAGTPEVLVAGRIAQGAAAALMGPQVLALIGRLFPGSADRARAFAWYGATAGLAGTGGQAVGGLLLAADVAGLGWRACYLVNVPLGLLALALIRLLPALDGRPRRARGALDPVGVLLSTAALVALVLPLVAGAEAAWPAWGWPGLAGAVALAGAFAAHQRRRIAAGRAPLLAPEVLRAAGFGRGVAAVALLFGSSAGLTFVLSLYLQDGLGMSPLAAGLLGVALNAAFLVTSLATGRLAGRLGRRLPVVGGVVLAAGLAAVGWAAPSVPAPGPPSGLVAGLAVTGAGMGLLMAPLTAAALAGVRQALAGTAAGVLGTAQEAAGVLGTALAGLVLFPRLGPDAGGWPEAFRTVTLLLAVAALAIAALAATAPRGVTGPSSAR